jgi:hypothetical protein
MPHDLDPESLRLRETAAKKKHWRRWGPYLSERQWGTVREDYSKDGDAWAYLPHELSRSVAYRWGEDGLAGISDNHQRLCFALALWNGRDPILKERLFGLTNPEGNHGEDVKEYYWYLDSTPTHSYMRWLYRYPQAEYPYALLVSENRRRSRAEPEFELVDTGVFDGDRFFDVSVEYAKADVDDLLIRIRIDNRGPEAAPIHVLPTLWFRNDWSWSRFAARPTIHLAGGTPPMVSADHPTFGRHSLAFSGAPQIVFTENETNHQRVHGTPNVGPRVKDGFHERVVAGRTDAVSAEAGSKCAGWYTLRIDAGGSATIGLRLSKEANRVVEGPAFDALIAERRAEADHFYERISKKDVPGEQRMIQRQAFAGMLWTKQWYHYVVEDWLNGDPLPPLPPKERLLGRNAEWRHLYNDDVMSMPDKWEYPWYATWDSAFHAIVLAMVDPDFAKRQLELFTREWYMHPNGQLPAYEWSLSDVNPPVHAWAAYRVYKIDRNRSGQVDTGFLERVFHKLLMNFTWWVNRKDTGGRNLFQGGFLGMDNIGVFDRSQPLPTGGFLEQSDGTSWMAMYSLNLLAISWELARTNAAYEDVASKFFEHFLYICDAMRSKPGVKKSLWSERDGFFYDTIALPGGAFERIRLRSMVGLVPLLAVEVLDREQLERMPGFKRRLEWFAENRIDLTCNISCVYEPGSRGRFLFSIVNPDQLRRVLRVMLDENEFLSPYGIRSLSKVHDARPYTFSSHGFSSTVRYEPGDSESGLFGGNSNWRGPIWLPVNYLLIEALQRYHHFWGDSFQVECPTGSGRLMHLGDVAKELARRLVRIFTADREAGGRRPVFGATASFQDPEWRDLLPFPEFFHGDSGAGLGASHQTGWTGLIAKLIEIAAS